MTKRTYDYAYRPLSYWDSPASVLAYIKSERRRRYIEQAIRSGNLDELKGPLLNDRLTKVERIAVGKIHPC